MKASSVGMTIYRAVLVAGISIGGSVLQEELKSKLGSSAALVISVMLAALIFAVVENFSVLVIQKTKILRRLFVPESRIEGWWTDVVINKQTGYPEYGGIIYITYDNGSLQISGTTYGLDGREHGTFRSHLAVFEGNILDFSYVFSPASGAITEDPGFGRYIFQRSDDKPDSFGGFFLDSFNVMSMTINARKVKEKHDISRCNDGTQRADVFVEYLARLSAKRQPVAPRETVSTATSESEAFKLTVLHFTRGEFESARKILERIEPKRSIYGYAREYVSQIIDDPSRRVRQPFDTPRAFEVFNTYGPEQRLKRQIAVALADDLKGRPGNIRLGCVGPGDGVLLKDTLERVPDRTRVRVVGFEPNPEFARTTEKVLANSGLIRPEVHVIQVQDIDPAVVGAPGKLDVVHCVFSLMCIPTKERKEALSKLRQVAHSVVVVEFDDSVAEKQGLDPERIAAVQARFTALIQAIVDESASGQHGFDSIGVVSFLMPVMFGYFAGDERSTYEQSADRWRAELVDAGFVVRSSTKIAFPEYAPAVVIVAD